MQLELRMRVAFSAAATEFAAYTRVVEWAYRSDSGGLVANQLRCKEGCETNKF